MNNPAPEPTPAPSPEPTPEQSFTQADVDKIIGKTRTEERRKAAEKYADYDDLKAKAGQSTTLEERVAQIESTAKAAEQRAMRAEIANAKGLTPGQAKRLVGESREELEADADELLKDIGDQKKQGNHVPREGHHSQPQADPMRAFTRNLFGGGE